MCYIIKPNDSFVFETMTVTIEKKNSDIDGLKVWITSNYDFMGATQDDPRHFPSYRFNAPFGEKYFPRITIKETIIKPLNCKLSDIEYISEEQCLVNIFITEHFSACPLKCAPIQKKAFQYMKLRQCF